MVVQIPGRHQFLSPRVKTVDAGIPRRRAVVAVKQRRIGFQFLQQATHREPVVSPDVGVLLQPALEIGSPEDLVDELAGLLQGMRAKHLGQHFRLGNQAVTDIR